MKIIFEFVGGFMDGRSVVGYTDRQPTTDEEREALRFYQWSKEGAVGTGFIVVSGDTSDPANSGIPEADKITRPFIQVNKYDVFERSEVNGEALVRMRYVPEKSA